MICNIFVLIVINAIFGSKNSYMLGHFRIPGGSIYVKNQSIYEKRWNKIRYSESAFSTFRAHVFWAHCIFFFFASRRPCFLEIWLQYFFNNFCNLRFNNRSCFYYYKSCYKANKAPSSGICWIKLSLHKLEKFVCDILFASLESSHFYSVFPMVDWFEICL